MKALYNKILGTVLFFTVVLVNTNAQTNVSGGIYVNTTWSMANSPYIVVDTVVVFPNTTLTIEPGVVVRFADNKRIEIRQARLIANGTVSDSITFTSNSNSPSPGIWGEVIVNGGTFTSELSYCNFSYARCGIYFDAVRTLNIKHSNFTDNINGLYCGYLNGTSDVFIDTSNFVKNTTHGITGKLKGSINSCRFTKNQVGLFGEGWDALITNCIVDSNDTGIDVCGFSMDNCNVMYNQTGVKGGCGWRYLKNSAINYNSAVGLHLAGDSVMDCEIKYNGIGFRDLAGKDPNVVTRCSIESNSIGIQSEGTLTGTISKFYCNRICNNLTFDLIYNVAFGNNAVVEDNYWCSIDSAVIASRIHDGYNDINLGLVDFMPFDTSRCTITTDIKSNALPPISFRMFPNPFSNQITFSLADHEQTTVSLYNFLGQQVLQQTFRNSTTVNTEQLAAGIYFYEIRNSKGSMKTEKVVKQ